MSEIKDFRSFDEFTKAKQGSKPFVVLIDGLVRVSMPAPIAGYLYKNAESIIDSGVDMYAVHPGFEGSQEIMQEISGYNGFDLFASYKGGKQVQKLTQQQVSQSPDLLPAALRALK